MLHPQYYFVKLNSDNSPRRTQVQIDEMKQNYKRLWLIAKIKEAWCSHF